MLFSVKRVNGSGGRRGCGRVGQTDYLRDNPVKIKGAVFNNAFSHLCIYISAVVLPANNDNEQKQYQQKNVSHTKRLYTKIKKIQTLLLSTNFYCRIRLSGMPA
jgi:hypothetical protein